MTTAMLISHVLACISVLGISVGACIAFFGDEYDSADMGGGIALICAIFFVLVLMLGYGAACGANVRTDKEDIKPERIARDLSNVTAVFTENGCYHEVKSNNKKVYDADDSDIMVHKETPWDSYAKPDPARYWIICKEHVVLEKEDKNKK